MLNKKDIVVFPDFLTILPNIMADHGLSYRKDVAYHYTDISGFKGILEDTCLWASNTHFQNDREEYFYGLKKATSVLNDSVKSCSDPFLISYFKKLNAEINSGFSLRITGEFSSKDIFTISFWGLFYLVSNLSFAKKQGI